MEVQDAQDVLHMFDTANVFRTCGTFTVCEDQTVVQAFTIRVRKMGSTCQIHVLHKVFTDQIPLLYSGVCPYSEDICDTQKSVSFATPVSLHLPEVQKSEQT